MCTESCGSQNRPLAGLKCFEYKHPPTQLQAKYMYLNVILLTQLPQELLTVLTV